MLDAIKNYLATNAWLVQTLMIIFISFIINWFEISIYRNLTHRLQKNQKIWDDTLVEAAHMPVYSFIWFIAIIKIIPIIAKHLGYTPNLSAYILPISSIALIIALFWFSMRYIKNVERRAIELSKAGVRKIDITSVHAISQISRVIVIVIAILLLMNNFGIKITALLAAGGIGGIAIGFAAKDTIANLIGGMMIFWDRPFSVGDWVRSPDRNIEGTVEYIGWRLTCIRTFDKRPLYVPNGTFSTISVENPSRMTNRRIKTTIGLRYDDAEKVGAIVGEVEAMLKNHDDIDSNNTLIVKLYEFGPSSLNFLVYTFTKTTVWTEFQAVQQDVLLKIIDIITKHGAECAFPTNTLHVPEGLLVKQEA